MKKELKYPLIVISFFSLIVAMIILSLQKIGPDMNPPRQSVTMDALQTSYISVKYADGSWLYSNRICSPGMMLIECNTFDWKNFNLYKLPEGKNTISVFIAQDLSKRRAVEFFALLKRKPIKSLMLSSPIDSSISNSRKADPSVLFSASLNQIMKWKLFSHLGLSSVYSFNSDFLVIDDKIESLLNKKLLEEIRRRNIAILYTKARDRTLLTNEYVLVK